MSMEAGNHSLSRQAANRLSRMDYGDIPVSVVSHVKSLILDTVGTGIAASGTAWGRQLLSMGGLLSAGGACTAFGSDRKLGAVAATLANGSLAHALDFDDTYFAAIVHPSCCVVPACLAAAETGNASGRDMIVGAVAGYEFLLRVARAGLNNFFKDNFHTTGLLGPLGAAAAACRVMGLSAEQTSNAFGIAAGMGGGLLQTMREGNQVKALQAGYAAHGGMLAALLALEGVDGPQHIFEGELGLYQTYLGKDRYDLASLIKGIGQHWYSVEVAIKMFPGAHRHHFFVESALNLMKRHGLRVEDIVEIRCLTSEQHQFYNFSPAGYRPPNTHAAKFSVPFLVAAALRDGRINAATFTDETIRDEKLLDLASKVTYSVRDDAESPEGRGHVIIRLKEGGQVENVQSYIRGLPELPATREDLSFKFRDNVAGLMSESDARTVNDRITNVEKLERGFSLFDGVAFDVQYC